MIAVTNDATVSKYAKIDKKLLILLLNISQVNNNNFYKNLSDDAMISIIKHKYIPYIFKEYIMSDISKNLSYNGMYY